MADWLDKVFYGFDRGFFIAMHDLCNSAGEFITPIFKVITFLGNGGWFFLVLGVILLLFKNTRKSGVAVLLAIAVGAIITNLALKNLVDRTRPYLKSVEYRGFWQAAQGAVESEKSFPSGHTTVTMATATALFLTLNKKWSWTGFLFAILMGLTRIYFTVHYATDVLAGLVVGAVAGVVGYYLTKLIFNAIEKHRDKKFCSFVLDKDIVMIFKKFNKD